MLSIWYKTVLFTCVFTFRLLNLRHSSSYGIDLVDWTVRVQGRKHRPLPTGDVRFNEIRTMKNFCETLFKLCYLEWSGTGL